MAPMTPMTPTTSPFAATTVQMRVVHDLTVGMKSVNINNKPSCCRTLFLDPPTPEKNLERSLIYTISDACVIMATGDMSSD